MPVDRGGPAPPRGPVVTQFKATPKMLPPGSSQRKAVIDKLVTRSFTATGRQTSQIAAQLAGLHLSKEEERYARLSSGTRGDAAIRKADPVGQGVAQALQFGINPHTLQHPLQRLEGKGQFAPTDVVGRDAAGKPIRGYASSLPWFGGGEAAGLKAANAATHLPRRVSLGGTGEGGAPLRPGEHGPAHPGAGFETQFPLSPAHMTAWAQRHLDRLSEHLTGPATRLSESENSAARAAGKVVTKASARARVPIQAGKNLRQEARRATALRAEEVKTLTPSLLHGGSGSQLAHFWWAQLPERLRNVEGLKAVRGKLAEERATIADRVASVSNKTPGVRKTPQLRRGLEDLRSADANLAKLDKVIAKPPAYQPHIVEAARTLMHDREQALVAAGKLDAAGADTRKGIVSRWLGHEPTGEEVYLGHRLEEQRTGALTPGGAGLGRGRLPAGVGKENKMVLASTGRVRQSMKTAVEDWQRAMSYHFTTTAKDELARMGAPIGPEGPKPGHLVVNPQGHTLPRTWKLDEETRAAIEGVHPEDVHLNDLTEYAKNTLAAGADRQRLLEAAAQAGHAADLRQVPEDVARRYFAQFVPHKVVAGTVPGVVNSTALWRKAADLTHDLVYASLIYSNPGYIPANTVANLVMAGIHQGAFLPVNLIRGGQAYFGSGPKLRELLNAEVGMGATRAASSQGRYPGSRFMDAAIGKVAGIPDNVPRISAFMHEAARVGVISKASPVLSKRDKAALLDLLTNPARRPLLNDVRDRANQAMVDFERLGAHEKATAKRLFFVWAWTRGATRYPARFILDHPLRSIAAGYALAGAPGAPSDVQAKLKEYTPSFAHGMPSWLNEAISTGHKTVKGVSYPSVLPTTSISPVSTPLQVYRTGRDIVDGSAAQGAQSLLGYANPLLPSAVAVAGKTDPFGQHVSYKQALEGQAQRLSPLSGLAKGLLHPKSGGVYPGDATRLGRLERALRVFPVAIDPKVAYQSRLKQGLVPQAEQDAHTHTVDQQTIDAQLKALGPQVPPAWQKAARAAQTASTDRNLAYKAAQKKLPKGTSLAEVDRYKITLQVLHDRKLLDDARYKAGVAAAARMTDKQLRHWRDYAWRKFGFGDAGGPGAILSTVHREHNKLPVVQKVRTPATAPGR